MGMIREHIWTYNSLYYLKMPIHKVLKDGVINIVDFENGKKVSIKYYNNNKFSLYTLCDIPEVEIISENSVPQVMFYKNDLDEDSVRLWLKTLNEYPKKEDISHFKNLLEEFSPGKPTLLTGKEIV